MYPPHSLALTTGPGAEPITRAQCYLQERLTPTGDSASPEVFSHPEDVLIDLYIVAVRECFETQTRRALITQTWTMTMAGCPSAGFIEIPKLNLQSITTIKYIDEDGNQQTWSDSLYEVDITSDPGRVQPIEDETYPSTQATLGAVEIKFIAGYGDAGTDINQTLILAMLLTFGHFYQNRESIVIGTIAQEVPQTAKDMIKPFIDKTYTREDLQ